MFSSHNLAQAACDFFVWSRTKDSWNSSPRQFFHHTIYLVVDALTIFTTVRFLNGATECSTFELVHSSNSKLGTMRIWRFIYPFLWIYRWSKLINNHPLVASLLRENWFRMPFLKLLRSYVNAVPCYAKAIPKLCPTDLFKRTSPRHETSSSLHAHFLKYTLWLALVFCTLVCYPQG